MKTLQWSIFLVVSLWLVGCSKNEIVGTSKIMAESRLLSAFSAVEVSGTYTINLTIGTSQAVSITTNGNLLQFIQTKVSGKTLTVQTKKGYVIRPQAVPSINIVVPKLSSLSASGNNQLVAKGLTHGDLKVDLSGANTFTGGGSVKSLAIRAAGNTVVDTQKLNANDVSLDSSGNTKAIVNATDHLDISIMGTGTITYLGNPSVKQSIHGSGTVTKAREIVNK